MILVTKDGETSILFGERQDVEAVHEVLQSACAEEDLLRYLKHWSDDPRIEVHTPDYGPVVRELLRSTDPGARPEFLGTIARGAPTIVRGDGVGVIGDRAIVAAHAAHAGPKGRFVKQLPVSDIQSMTPLEGFESAIRITGEGGFDVAFNGADVAERRIEPLLQQRSAGKWVPTKALPKPVLVDFLGGPDNEAEKANVQLVFDAVGCHVKSTLGASRLDFPWESVVALSVEGADALQKRITVTRMVLVGLFALAWKKKEQSSFFVIETQDGEYIFSSRQLSVQQLRAHLATVLAGFKGSDATSMESTGASAVADRIRQLAALHEDGLISVEEFEEKRRQLLGEL